jgi:MFS family permease
MGLWSLSQMCTGLAPGLFSMILTRLGLGIFETAQNPVANLVIRQWAPRSERAFASSLTVVVILLTIAITFTTSTQTWNFALVNDLLHMEGEGARAAACLTVGGNAFGIVAPIVTGYLVSATGSFTIPFVLCGVMTLMGALSELFVVRRPIGE